ncbi:U-box domain-containing protein 52-like [Tripterygium wilfordii]|uniref:RING-type E3 ubiquitin transferase n=1 Tax=Tripterygium wilfordii TaxID=458696 RepID=A0A7J7DNY0_TRIWF|nr:U-box domain-containing protein 52-like [Tripterygium wilfordii]
MLDPAVPDWPVEEALSFAKLSLSCAELRRKDRPDIGKVVLPELNRLRTLAEDTMQSMSFVGSAGLSPNHSQVSLQLEERLDPLTNGVSDSHIGLVVDRWKEYHGNQPGLQANISTSSVMKLNAL